MGCDLGRATLGLLACAAVLLGAGRVAAAANGLVTASLLSDGSVTAPVITFRSLGDSSARWTVGVSGWTLSAERERTVKKDRRVFVSVDATPLNAHSSNRMFVDGRRQRALEYRNASYRVRAGLRLQLSERTAVSIGGAAIDESVRGAQDPGLREFWRRPYIGIELGSLYRHVTADDPFDGRIEGLEVVSSEEIFAGRTAWSRLSLEQRAGKRIGRLALRQSAMLAYGWRLNTVSDFLLGGSWDTLGPRAVYGYRYAEFRGTRAAVAGAGADYVIGRSTTAGLRVGLIAAPGLTRAGAAILAGTQWRGARFQVGTAIPFHRTSAGVRQSASLFASVSAAVFRP